jgi:hypothetical protein
VESSCEHGDEPSGYIKCWETIEQLHNCWPLKLHSAPQSYLFIYLFILSLFLIYVKLLSIPKVIRN